MRARRISAWPLAALVVLPFAYGSDSRVSPASVPTDIGPRSVAAAPRVSAILFSGRGGVSAVDSDGQGLRTLVRGAGSPSESPDGRHILFRSGAGLGVVDLGSSTRRILDSRGSVQSVGSGRWDPDSGSVVYVAFEPGIENRIYRVAVTGGKPQRLAVGEQPEWSPDGSTIAFVRDFSIYLMDADGSRVRKVVAGSEAEEASAPAWSPDANELAFTVERVRVPPAGQPSIEAIRADGGGRRTIETSDGVGDFAPAFAWSPDGRSIAFDDGDDLSVVNTHGSGRRTLVSGAGSSVSQVPAWSPDGTQIAFGPGQGVWVVSAAGGDAVRVTKGVENFNDFSEPQWDRLGRRASQLGGTPGTAPPLPSGVLIPAGVRTPAQVNVLSADGGRVAYLSPIEGCGSPEVWERASRRVFAVADPSCTGLADQSTEVLLAGPRVVWVHTGVEGSDTYVSVLTATLGRPWQSEDVSTATAFAGNVAGEGGLIVFNTWDESNGGVSRPQLWRLIGTKSPATRRLLKTGSDAYAVSSVGGGRIAVVRRDGSVSVLRADGSLLRRFSSPSARVSATSVSRGRLLVVLDDALAVYDLRSGALLHKWSVPALSDFADANERLAVLVVGKSIVTVDLTNGRRPTVVEPGQGPIHAALGDDGLFYSRGNVVSFRSLRP